MAEKTMPPPEQKSVKQEETRSNENYLRPPVDILESEDGLTILVDLPGITKERLSIGIDNGILTIEGTADTVPAGREVYREFTVPSYYRQFQIPDELDQQQAKAELVNGVLTLRLFKSEAAKPRKITVQVA
jgi:HSP20 family molecular chaperone IbpA